VTSDFGWCWTSSIGSSTTEQPPSNFQVRSRSNALVIPFSTDLFVTQGPSPQCSRQPVVLLPALPTLDSLRADILRYAPHFLVLRFLPSVAAGCPGYLLPGWDARYPTMPLVFHASKTTGCSRESVRFVPDYSHKVSNEVEPAGKGKDNDS